MSHDDCAKIVSLANGKEMYVNRHGFVGVTHHGRFTNTANERREWTRHDDGTITISDGRQLFVTLEGWAACEHSGHGENTEEKRRVWKCDREDGGILTLADGMQLYSNNKDWCGVALPGTCTNKDDLRRVWRFGNYQQVHLQLPNSQMLYINLKGQAGVAMHGQYTNTHSERNTWLVCRDTGIIMLMDGRELYINKAGFAYAAVREAEENVEDSRRHWQWNERSGLIYLADGSQLYAGPKGWCCVAAEGAYTNTENDRRAWAFSAVHDSVLLTLEDRRQLYTNPRGCVGLAYENDFTNQSKQRRQWQFGDGGTVSLDSGKQLYIDSKGWACVDKVDEGENTEPARRKWIQNAQGVLALADGRQLYCNHSGWAGAAQAGQYSNTETARRRWITAPVALLSVINDNGATNLSCSKMLSIGRLMHMTNAGASVVSTPEYSGRLPCPPHTYPVMSTIEKLVNRLAPKLTQGYDFKGSSSSKALAGRQPDSGMKGDDWINPEKIALTQWSMYWRGHVHATVQTMLMTGAGCPINDKLVECVVPGTKVLLAFSITGGPITQTEKCLIPDILQSVKADLSTRNMETMANILIIWVHFECITHLVRALSGYGTIDLFTAINGSIPMREPQPWRDGEYDCEGDLLLKANVPGNTPEERMEFMMDEAQGVTSANSHLVGAVVADDPDLVTKFLEEGADPNFKCPKYSIPVTAMRNSQPSVLEMLIKAGMHTNAAADYLQEAAEIRALATKYDVPDMDIFVKRIDRMEAVLAKLMTQTNSGSK